MADAHAAGNLAVLVAELDGEHAGTVIVQRSELAKGGACVDVLALKMRRPGCKPQVWDMLERIARGWGCGWVMGVSPRPLDRLTGGAFEPVATHYAWEVAGDES